MWTIFVNFAAILLMIVAAAWTAVVVLWGVKIIIDLFKNR